MRQLVLQCFSAGPILAWLIHSLSGSDRTLAAAIFCQQVLIAHAHMKCQTNSRFAVHPGPDISNSLKVNVSHMRNMTTISHQFGELSTFHRTYSGGGLKFLEC